MPIEIKELIIKATVEDPRSKDRGGEASGQATLAPLDQEAIIAACVEQVLQILKDQKER